MKQSEENTQLVSSAPKKRVLLLDILRGFSLVSMVIYHGMYDLVVLFGINAPWYFSWQGFVWQQSICWTFILVSGASLHFSRKPYRRGLQVLGCGLAVTLVTYIAMPSQLVLFGVLHFMGFAMLITAALLPLMKKILPLAGAAVSFVIFMAVYNVPWGYIGVFGKVLFELPTWLYSQSWAFPLGFPTAAFMSSDYFPVIPWLFLFWTGWFLWAAVGGSIPATDKKPGILARVGRHSLLIYMLHQPVLYGVMWAVFNLIK